MNGKKLLGWVLIATLLLTLGGCGSETRLKDLETMEVEDAFGTRLVLPATWVSLDLDTEEAEESTGEAEVDADAEEAAGVEDLYAYVNPEGTMVFMVAVEAGAMEYLNIKELGEAYREEYAGALQDAAYSKVTVTEKKYACLIQGEDSYGSQSAILMEVQHPYTGLRYQVVFTCTADAYEENAVLLQDILDSCQFDEDEEQVYQKIEELRRGEQPGQ